MTFSGSGLCIIRLQFHVVCTCRRHWFAIQHGLGSTGVTLPSTRSRTSSVDGRSGAAGGGVGVSARLEKELERTLREFVRMKTVSSDPSLREDCFRGAKYLAHLLESLGTALLLLSPHTSWPEQAHVMTQAQPSVAYLPHSCIGINGLIGCSSSYQNPRCTLLQAGQGLSCPSLLLLLHTSAYMLTSNLILDCHAILLC